MMFTAQVVEALSKGEEPPIMVRKDKADDFGAILAQLGLKQGLKAWGERAEANATKEMQQMHDMSAFFPRYVKPLSREE